VVSLLQLDTFSNSSGLLHSIANNRSMHPVFCKSRLLLQLQTTESHGQFFPSASSWKILFYWSVPGSAYSTVF